MLDLILRKKISKATIVILENPLRRDIIEPKAGKDIMYGQLLRKLYRFTLLAEVLYNECLKKRKRRPTLPNWDYIGLHFELFFLYLRTIYDYFPIILNKELGTNELPNSFNSLLKKHIKTGELKKFERNMKENFVKFMKGESGFQEIKDIRDSIKMRTTTLDIFIKNDLIYVSGEYINYKNKKIKINEMGAQLIFNYCWLTAGWMIVLNDLIKNNKNNKKLEN